MPESESILAPHIEELLEAVGPILSESGMVLVGGTALALQLNHRRSIDLDFFGEDEFDPEELFSRLETELRPKHTMEVTGKDINTLSLLINDVKVDILRHRYPAASAPIDKDGIRIASLADISAMKLNAITNRGAKKDFYDVYYLLQQFSLEQLLEWYGKKYRNHDPFFVIQSLTYFADAAAQPEPDLSEKIEWKKVKAAIEAAVRDFMRA